MKKRNETLDLAKYIASLFIVGIHTALFRDVNETLGFFVVDIIFRCAVPFFALCSGYLIAKKCDKNGKHEKKNCQNAIKKQWLNIFKIYLVWSAIYLLYSIPSWIKSGWFSVGAFVDYVIAVVRIGSHYHLWYLISLLYALIVFGLLISVMNIHFLGMITVLLWVIKVCSYAYMSWLPMNIQNILSLCYRFSSLSDALFCLLPLLLTGYMIAFSEEKKTKTVLIGTFFSFGCLCIEAFLLRSRGQEAVSYIFFTLPFAYFLFQLLLKVELNKVKNVRILGGASLFIYCFHPMFVESIGAKIENSIVCYLSTIIVSTLGGVLYVIIKSKFRIIRGK